MCNAWQQAKNILDQTKLHAQLRADLVVYSIKVHVLTMYPWAMDKGW